MESTIRISSAIRSHTPTNMRCLIIYLEHFGHIVTRYDSYCMVIKLHPALQPELAEWIPASYLGVALWQKRWELVDSWPALVDSVKPPSKRFWSDVW